MLILIRLFLLFLSKLSLSLLSGTVLVVGYYGMGWGFVLVLLGMIIAVIALARSYGAS